MFDFALFDRSADLRGDYPCRLNEELGWFTGKLLVRYLREAERSIGNEVESPGVLVGRDGRLSSPSLYNAIIQGVAAAGGTPIPCGMATTDTVMWSVGEGLGGAVGGLMITASHNPPQYNGFKMAWRGRPGQPLQTIGPKLHLTPLLGELEKEAVTATTSAVAPHASGTGLRAVENFVEAACQRAKDHEVFDGTVVFDPGNGVGSVLIQPLKERLPNVAIESIATIIDGNFPTRPSDPALPGATKLLQEKVLGFKAKFGAAFDGDADRVALMDEWGEMVTGHCMLAAIIDSTLSKVENPKDAPIVFSATSSWTVIETIRKFGAKAVISKVGQDTIKWVMETVAATAGGESSGHFNIPDSYNVDSGLMALMSFWQTLHDSGKTVSETINALNPWPNSGEINMRVDCDDWAGVGGKVIAELQSRYSSGGDAYVLPLDGVSVYMPMHPDFATTDDLFQIDSTANPDGDKLRILQDGYTPDKWFSIRKSNNEPLIRLNVETRDASQLKGETYTLIQTVQSVCKSVGADVTIVNWDNMR